MKNKLSGHIKSFPFHVMYFQSQFDSFANFFKELYIFAGIIDLFKTSFLALYILITPCLNEDQNVWK